MIEAIIAGVIIGVTVNLIDKFSNKVNVKAILEQITKAKQEGNTQQIKEKSKELKKVVDEELKSNKELKDNKELKELQSILDELNDYLQQAYTSYKKYDFTNSIRYYNKALKIQKDKFGDSSKEVADTYTNLGLLYQAKGNLDEALKQYEKALDIFIEIEGANSLSVASTYGNLGNLYKAKSNYDEAMSYYKKALTIYEGMNDKIVELASTYNNLGNLYQAKGSHDKTLKYIRKAHTIYEFVLGSNHPQTKKLKQAISQLENILNNQTP